MQVQMKSNSVECSEPVKRRENVHKLFQSSLGRCILPGTV